MKSRKIQVTQVECSGFSFTSASLILKINQFQTVLNFGFNQARYMRPLKADESVRQSYFEQAAPEVLFIWFTQELDYKAIYTAFTTLKITSKSSGC